MVLTDRHLGQRVVIEAGARLSANPSQQRTAPLEAGRVGAVGAEDLHPRDDAVEHGAVVLLDLGNQMRSIPQPIRNRLSLARELSYGNVKTIKKMSPVERSYVQKRHEFESAVLKLVSGAKNTYPKSSTLTIPYSGLMNVKYTQAKLLILRREPGTSLS